MTTRPMLHYSNIAAPTEALVRHGPDTVVGLAFSPTCLALVYLTAHSRTRTVARRSHPVRVEVGCDIVIHHGFHQQARRLLTARIDQCWRHARALAAHNPVPDLRSFSGSRVLSDLVGLWRLRAGFGSEIMTMIDLAYDIPDAGAELLNAVIAHGFAPGAPPEQLAEQTVLVEAFAAAAQGARHLNLLDPTDLDIAALLDQLEPPARSRTRPSLHQAQPRNEARPRRVELTAR
ncbi:hypothetical protein BOX37_28155 [Nocardia mangyaensis]|uniref:Uncharacterized protein n=1 Tax=Nocardia mangyaensis TaxID=2213200 RepID=A0A1J0VYU0_9NOCA|nr:hypothetical protein [Nocardia mangyaensis]APE37161.1 hypothetical protein BOX37_28155 [Nocardia mangyaensis]MBC7299370.1 hypothetical protein [Nocardia sp.]